MKNDAKLNSVSVNLSAVPPFIGLTGTWIADENQQKAAWEMYVELITRISIVELKPDEGLLREALSSLHKLFDITRHILRKYGPSVAITKKGSTHSFGSLAVIILNNVLRPVLAEWHPKLLEYENKKTGDISQTEYEKVWPENSNLRKKLDDIRPILSQYAVLLAKASGVPSLH